MRLIAVLLLIPVVMLTVPTTGRSHTFTLLFPFVTLVGGLRTYIYFAAPDLPLRWLVGRGYARLFHWLQLRPRRVALLIPLYYVRLRFDLDYGCSRTPLLR